MDNGLVGYGEFDSLRPVQLRSLLMRRIGGRQESFVCGQKGVAVEIPPFNKLTPTVVVQRPHGFRALRRKLCFLLLLFYGHLLYVPPPRANMKTLRLLSMIFLSKILFKVVGYSISVLVASSLIPGFTFTGDWRMLLAAGIILTVAHTVILPILKLLTFPLALITFGVFHVILSALILWAALLFTPGVHVASLSALIWALTTIGVTGIILSYI